MQKSLMNYNKYESIWKKNLIDDEVKYAMQIINLSDEEAAKYPLETGWIIHSLRSSGINPKYFKKILLVGSGAYPYSLIDCCKNYPNLQYYGIEIDNGARVIAKLLISKLKLSDKIQFFSGDALEFDYSDFGPDSLIFLSYDLNKRDKILEKINKITNIFICYPRKAANDRNLYI